MSSSVFHLSMRASERLRGRGRLFLPELFFGRRGIVREVHNLCKFWMWLEIQYMVSSTMYVTFAQSTLRLCFWFGCRPIYYRCEQSSKNIDSAIRFCSCIFHYCQLSGRSCRDHLRFYRLVYLGAQRLYLISEDMPLLSK
jgi:hypothetical protein